MSQSLADHLLYLLQASDEFLLQEGRRLHSNLCFYTYPPTLACVSYFGELEQTLWAAHDAPQSTLGQFRAALRREMPTGYPDAYTLETFEHLQEAPKGIWRELPRLVRLVEGIAAGRQAIASCEGDSEEELFRAWRAGRTAYYLQHLRQVLTEFLQLLEVEGAGGCPAPWGAVASK